MEIRRDALHASYKITIIGWMVIRIIRRMDRCFSIEPVVAPFSLSIFYPGLRSSRIVPPGIHSPGVIYLLPLQGNDLQYRIIKSSNLQILRIVELTNCQIVSLIRNSDPHLLIFDLFIFERSNRMACFYPVNGNE